MNCSLPSSPARLIGLGWLLLALLSGRTYGQVDPAAELAAFRVLEGFEVTLFASEREGVRKPIQIRFDPDGRLWVVGSTVYPQIKPSETPDDQVIVLEDIDRDGRADRSTVFARGLQIPTGLEVGDGGLYVGAATELLHFRDTDGDGKADQRRVVLRGFGTGDTHQTINSFCWGPNGELMMSQGLHAEGRIETPWGISQLRQAGVWRFWPRQVRLDPFWSGAMGAHNPFGTAFDRWGQPFVFAGNGHGIYHLTQAMIATDHFLEQRWIWNQGRKFGGADFVENSHWPEANQGEVVSGGYLQNTVERFRLTDEGATFKAERLPPLIESTNTAFRIVDARFGPDGALYLCDWYNPVIGHYQDSFRDPARDKAHGRIWRVTAKGRPLVRWTALGALPTPEVVARLGSTERWDRQMAQRVLADRDPKVTAAALRKWTESLPPGTDAAEHARFEALGAGLSLGRGDTNLLAQQARSARPEARAAAARVAGELARRAGPGQLEFSLALLETLVADQHPRVRLEAVVACSYVPDARAMDVAAIVADRPLEPALEYAFTQCVVALRRWWAPAQARGELRLTGQPARAAAFAKADGGAGSTQYAAGRLRRIGEVALEAEAIRQLSDVVARAGGPGDLGALLSARSFTVGTNYDASLQARRLREATDSSRQRSVLPSGDLAPALSRLFESPSSEVRVAALRAAGVWRVAALHPRLEATVSDASVGLSERVAAVEGLAAGGDPKTVLRLASWAQAGNLAEVRAAALAGWVTYQPQEAAGATADWFRGEVDPAVVAGLASAFLRQRDALGALTLALQAQAPSPGVARAFLEQLARSGRHDPSLNAVLQAAAGRSPRTQPWSPTDIPTVVAAAREKGDRTRGAQLFQAPRLACVTCHSVDGTSGRIGPELGALGTAQTPEFIVGALLEPQREVKEGFMAHELVTKDGTTYQGYLRGETPEGLTLLDHLSGQTVALPRGTLAEQRQLGSLMPAGLLDGLTLEEVRDLVAYLAGLGRK